MANEECSVKTSFISLQWKIMILKAVFKSFSELSCSYPDEQQESEKEIMPYKSCRTLNNLLPRPWCAKIPGRITRQPIQ